MEKLRIAVLGVGATGSVLAAALLSKYPDTVLIDRKPELGKALREKGINVSGAITCRNSPIRVNKPVRIYGLKNANG